MDETFVGSPLGRSPRDRRFLCRYRVSLAPLIAPGKYMGPLGFQFQPFEKFPGHVARSPRSSQRSARHFRLMIPLPSLSLRVIGCRGSGCTAGYRIFPGRLPLIWVCMCFLEESTGRKFLAVDLFFFIYESALQCISLDRKRLLYRRRG